MGAAYERVEARDEKVNVREDSSRGAGVSQKDPSGAASPTGSHDTGSSAPPVVLRHLWLQRACWNVCTKLPSTGGRWRQEVPPVARSAAGDRTPAEFVCSHVPMSLQPFTLTPRPSFTLSSLGGLPPPSIQVVLDCTGAPGGTTRAGKKDTGRKGKD